MPLARRGSLMRMCPPAAGTLALGLTCSPQDPVTAWKLVAVPKYARLDRTAETVEPRHVWWYERMQGATIRTARIAKNKELPESAWTSDRRLA